MNIWGAALRASSTSNPNLFIYGFWFFLEEIITHNTRPVSEVSWGAGRAIVSAVSSNFSDYILGQDFSIISIAGGSLVHWARPILSSTASGERTGAAAIDAIDVNYWTRAWEKKQTVPSIIRCWQHSRGERRSGPEVGGLASVKWWVATGLRRKKRLGRRLEAWRDSCVAT